MTTTAPTYVDLHCHSTASDGTLTPTQVVQLARDSGLSALALTDHDTVGGIKEAQAEAQRLGIDFLPGIEISAEFPHPGTLHILGYGVNPDSPQLKSLTETLLSGRDNRNPRIIEKLNQLNVAITMDEVEAEARKIPESAPVNSDQSAIGNRQSAISKPIGRPHIAAVLLRKGYVSSIKQAFDKYLAQGAPAYFDKERLTPRQALQCIRDAGGLPVLAHPPQLRTENDAQLDRVVKDLVDLGLAGIEIIHSDHDATWIARSTALADKYGLLKTGGSDFHGSNKKDIRLGVANNTRIPRTFFDALLSALKR
jgi:predicted metal-dependent phosphoesterase TrpH